MSTQEFSGLRFQPGAVIVSGVVVTAAFGERVQIHRDQVKDILSGQDTHSFISPEAAARAEAEFARFYAISKGLVEQYNVAAEHKAIEVYLAELKTEVQQPVVAEGAQATL
jgi:hypothetical protein